MLGKWRVSLGASLGFKADAMIPVYENMTVEE
jgi:hypothetical protein